ncbi:DDE-domain-containing protein [Mycena sanguinolenta]|uniref:DDE-domain-containing protein n=1 Tax=Mycena sanguinolenta TaxID=230812 RepID=A0A8H6YDC8_9AGAR|nr:DDE-domain-containing protein [Mycena sanguinolenta]
MAGGLEILKKGYAALEKHVSTRKATLQARLKKEEPIDDEDSAWLDGPANLIDEKRALDLLESASDYDRGLARLGETLQAAVTRMKDFAAGVKSSVLASKVPSTKRKKPAQKPVIPAGKTPGKKKEVQPKFTRAEHATLEQRIEILDWHHANGANQTKTANHFARNIQTFEYAGSASKKSKRARQTYHPEVTEMMELWVEQAMRDKVDVSGEVLRQKWTAFAVRCGVPEEDRLALSSGWLDRLKKRLGLREFKRHGEAASADPKVVEEEKKRVQAVIKKGGFKACDVYNMDETGLFYGFPPDRGLSKECHSGVKGNKVRLTYAFTVNADGSDKLEPFIIGKAKQPRSFQRRTARALGFLYRNNAKAWMTTILYQEWIRNWDAELRLAGRQILLLQDNFSAHVPPDDLTNITVESFTANLTSHVQPLDQGIIRCFKAHYRSHFTQRAMDNYDRGVTPAKIYDIDQLQGMRLAMPAWEAVSATTIKNCWIHSGILPDSVWTSGTPPAIPIASLLNPVREAEKELNKCLDGLEERQVLQRANRLTIDDLVNPVSEQDTEQTTDQDIYDAVIASRNARDASDANGGDNDPDDDTEPVSRPTRREALAAAATVQNFIAALGDDYARKLDGLLATFGRATQLEATNAMADTSITDFFTRSE